ncbi:G-type lectin S-receptor-like serine/threonine-protein kinase At1g34300 [Olea europaea var. sylvestris]|uniref:Receptor-like serine/threonine-protein kinase n=1 Tax=Olea europaea subsp. europaea TaxID=158383 RepID=A0A8S0STG8_OLEEU|nr:G-type lectin S-receptor-like serine/threonine-protein kinase At1g34300 [Olea europaea var. sylvestris]CAA2996268.1 G-type lectin S-receptor-like serine threonine-kinase At1g34300 [Olea europaea subsp. europaea]
MKIPYMQMFCLIFIFFPTVISAADVSPGSTLYASNPQNSWDSTNGTFSLSFIQESENVYFAAIIYNGIPVWKAGGDPGGAVNSSAALRFLPDGNLQLVYTSTGFQVWQSNTAGRGVSMGALDDSGNFILRNRSGPVWTTFDNPTDTILPGQNFTVNQVLRSGLYSFRLSMSGNMTLRWNDTIEYYSSSGLNGSSVNSSLTSPSLGLQQPVGIFSLFDPTLSSPLIMARSNDYGEVTDDSIRFVKLDNDGNLRTYSSARNSGSGNRIVRWTAVSDQCLVFGYCGNMGICSYDDDFSPVCGCPSENFDLIDPKDPRKGCERTVNISNCSAREMLSLNRSTLLTYPPETSSQFYTASITACRSLCLSNNLCMGSTSLADGTGVCYLKLSQFISGYQSPTLTSTSYVKVCEPAMPNPPHSSREVHKNYDALKISVIVLGCCLILVILACLVWVFFYSRKPKFEGLPTWDSLSEYASALPVHFSYKELQQATKGFKDKLGEGGFGAVYQGVLTNKTLAAVKQLEGIEQGEKQFRMEVVTISSTHHLNLVRLLGFCSEGRHRLLVYEFMKNGSLDKFLFTSDEQPSKEVLNWGYRYNIALGTAKGITYLHEECRDCIVHSDIKPENILLDDNYNARISDFGLARLINTNGPRHRSIMSVRGTRGYLPPEWLANLPITSKADVYSYGMVLLEIISGRRNFDVSSETNHRRLSLWAYEEYEKGNIEAILDKRLLRHEVDTEQVIRAIRVSFWCIQEQPSHRPTMGKVVQMLEGISEIPTPPPFAATNPTAQFQVLPMVSSFQTVLNSSVTSSQTAENSSLTSEQKSERETSILLQEEASTT